MDGRGRPSGVKRIAAVSLLLLLLAACAKATNPGGGSDSGIRGVVLLGPMCPVERPDSPCPDKPMADIEVRVLDEHGAQIAGATTDAQGTFSVNVAPGSYRLVPVLPAGSGTRTAVPSVVSVPAHGFADAKVLVDSGIR